MYPYLATMPLILWKISEMLNKIIIADTSSLISLSLIGRLKILENLY